MSNSGSVDANGLTTKTDWHSITHLNTHTFQPRDAILFKKGDVWRNNALRIASSETEVNPIVYSTYRTGEKPEILGSVLVSECTNVSGNIWASTFSVEIDPWKIGYDGS